MQRLQFDLGEQISRKEYLKRKRRNSKLLKKRSKITYILMAGFMALAIYIIIQFVTYRKYNNFKYTAADELNMQSLYNIYFVTEGYTYDPVYSLSSILSSGENETSLLPESELHQIVAKEDYLYGIRDGALCRITKDRYEINELFEDKIKKYVIMDNNVVYTSGKSKKLKIYNLETSEKKEIDITSVEQIIAGEKKIICVTHSPDEKAMYTIKYDGTGKKKISGDDKVSYTILDEGKIYFINDSDEQKIYTMDINGDNKVNIADLKCVNSKGNLESTDGQRYMFIKNNEIYYINSEDENSLWKYNFSDKSKEKVISASVEILQNVDNTVFYKIKKERGVYLYNYETQFMALVTQRRVKEFVIDRFEDVYKEQ